MSGQDLLAKCQDAIVRAAEKAGVPPTSLSRVDYRRHKLPGDPHDRHFTEAGGYSIVKSMMRPKQAAPDVVEIHRGALAKKDLKTKIKGLTERIVELEDTLEAVAELRGAPIEPVPIFARERSSGLREATPVVLCSDWHVEETVAPAEVNGRNKYNPDIARMRVGKLCDGIMWLLDMHRGRFVIRDLVLWLGGDLITGYIHDELRETNAMTPLEAVLFAQELIVGELIDPILLETDLDKIVVPCSVGNHGRTTKRRQHKRQVQNSFEWMLYQSLRQRYADDERVEFVVAGGAQIYLDIYDKTLRFHHGDDIRYFGGIGGPLTPATKAIAGWDTFRKADITNVGHYHTYLDTPSFVQNGSLIGYNEFAVSIKATYSGPEQAFYLVDSKRGKVCSTRIWVD